MKCPKNKFVSTLNPPEMVTAPPDETKDRFLNAAMERAVHAPVASVVDNGPVLVYTTLVLTFP